MRLLTTKKAARILAEGLGWNVMPYDVEDAIERGRLRAEKEAGRRGRSLIPLEEVERLIEEDRQKKAREAEQEGSAETEEPAADVWDTIPRNGMAYLFGLNRRPRRRCPK